MPRSRSFFPDDAAVTAVSSFMVAGLVFLGVVGAVLVAGNDLGRTFSSDNDAAGHQVDAKIIVSRLLDSPGYYDDGGTAAIWADAASGADSLERLGLKSHDSPYLAFDKFQNLGLAPLKADDTDDMVNYPEARSSLGLDKAGLDFHIRAYPSLKSVEEILAKGSKDPNLRITYLGHQVATVSGAASDPSEGLAITEPRCTAGTDDYTLWSWVTNGGDNPALFEARFHAVLDGVSIDESVYSGLVPTVSSSPSEAVVNMTLEVPAANGAACTAGSSIEVEVWDHANYLNASSSTLTADHIASSTAPAHLSISPGTSYALNTSSPSDKDLILAYGGNLSKNDVIDIVVHRGDSSGPIVHAETVTVPQQLNNRDITVPIESLAADQVHLINLTFGAVTVHNQVMVLSSEPTGYTPAGSSVTYDWDEPVAVEVQLIEELAQKFCPYEYDSQSDSPISDVPAWGVRCRSTKPMFQHINTPSDQVGDVFPDDKDVVNDDLRWRIWDNDADGGAGAPRYDVVNTLVVGSNVAHNALTSEAIKDPIAEWVTGGGTLIVFGHDSKNVQWLQSIFHAGIDSSSGTIVAPDATHPVLHTADPLDYGSYDSNDKTWKFQTSNGKNSQDYFDNIVVQDGSPTLAVSKPGALGTGTVILTTWLPYNLAGDGPIDPDSQEAEQSRYLVNNFLMQGYRDLFLDYGPQLPAGGGAIPATGVADIDHPKLGPITLDITVWVFASS